MVAKKVWKNFGKRAKFLGQPKIQHLWLSLLLKVGNKTNSAFKYTLYIQKTTDYSKKRNCFPQGKFNHFHFVIAFAITFFHAMTLQGT